MEDEDLRRLFAVAEAWQSYRHRDMESACRKVAEELHEFGDARNLIDKLDELGDVVVSTLRALQSLSPSEREFMLCVGEMKVRRRIGPEGIKDKGAERIEMQGLADILKIRRDI